ncbi:hypothetical protein CORC01_06579 [Colletotrichum orchidophilum]|uniref:Uncharacterized protein n=1 Tax=Colletotrichum orchidophilum TaxID=1209926 RepID=A0A1G4B9R4_9PEZI|nr:uncharacterized protein CORC01_06579 [Colletotrichum orchidophilum]OHE98065.1 hypothetical protein CORC01_06579 [Colletotrichum orchidophilum]
MFFIIAAAHGHANYLPDHLSADELYMVLRLMDKYVVKLILAHWLQKWISQCPDHLSLCQDVAWLIGHEKILTDHVKADCEIACINERGDLTNQLSLTPCYYATIEGFDQEEFIKRTRRLFISQLISYLNSTLNTSQVHTSRGWNLCETHDKDCHAMIVGSLIEACDDANITHFVSSLMLIRETQLSGEPQFLGTVKELVDTIETISKSVVSTHGSNPFYNIDELTRNV